MRMWLESAAILAVSMLLMGSKIIIQVPQGGSIESSTGLFGCAAGEHCTIEINERQFSEAFTAVAEPGYVFAGWGNGAGEVCRSSRDAYCAELHSDEYAEYDAVVAGIRPGAVLTLTPTFSSDQRLQAAPGHRFSISSNHTTRYYEVGGATQEQIWAQLHGPANPLAADRQSGNKPVAQADFHYRYHFSSQLGSNATSCRVAAGQFAFRFETVLPRLADRQETSERLKHRWQRFQAQVTEHEAGHHAIYRQLVTQLPEQLAAIGDTPCDELAETVELTVAGAVNAVRHESTDYDQYHSSDAHIASSF